MANEILRANSHSVCMEIIFSRSRIGSLHGDITTDKNNKYHNEVSQFRQRHALTLLIKQVRNLFVK